MATEVLIAGSPKHNFTDSGMQNISGLKIWFGNISRDGFQIFFHFLDLLRSTWDRIATKLAIDSQTHRKTKREQKTSWDS